MNKMIKKIVFWLIITLSSFAQASKQIQIITDAEIENKIKSFITPLLNVAKLDPKAIKIRIITDPSYNAFVTNGGNIFIHSGLLIKFAYDPNILYGVLAHEIAHIYAGHLINLRQELEETKYLALAGTILGLAGMFAGGPDAGIFIGTASANASIRKMMSYSRGHEIEADKIAIDLLYKTNNNGQGLINFFTFMAKSEAGYDAVPYLSTHPMTQERLTGLQNAIKSKLGKFGNNVTQETITIFKRLATKLNAFISNPSQTKELYKNDIYGLSISYFRSGQYEKAIELLNKIIENSPNDPYLLELKAQYYFENGKLDLAHTYYFKALSLMPTDKLFKLEFAVAKINLASASYNNKLASEAITILNQIVAVENDNLMAYFMLSKAYALVKQQDKAILALAEYYFHQNAFGKSKILAAKVLKMSPVGSKQYLRASDILEYSKSSGGQ